MEVAPFFVDFHHFLSIFTIFYRFSRFTHFCRDLHFVAIYALFPQIFFGQNSHLRNKTHYFHVCPRCKEVYPKPSNILHLSRIWVKCKEVYPRCKEVYPRPPNILHLSRIWVKCKDVWGKSTPNEKDHFHKALPNVKNAYVTLRKFTPDLKIFYTDISAISVTLCNSDQYIENVKNEKIIPHICHLIDLIVDLLDCYMQQPCGATSIFNGFTILYLLSGRILN